MKARPIIFQGPMVRALWEGRKSQTRRPIVRIAGYRSIRAFGLSDTPGYDFHFRRPDGCWCDLTRDELLARCPYGVPGDLLWVRETLDAESYASKEWNGLNYRADGSEVLEIQEGWHPPINSIRTHYERGDNIPGGSFPYYMASVASIFMPRWASRLTLRITDVRVEMVQDISDADAIAEGIPDYSDFKGDCPADDFRDLWNSIHGPDAWGLNPFVWALTFDVIKASVDDVLREGV